MTPENASGSLLWLGLIPLLPLVAACLAALTNRGTNAVLVATAAMGGAMVVAFRAFSISWHVATPAYDNFTWIEVGGLSIDFGFILDPLTGAMLAMITLVGFLIFVYAGRYMRDDPRLARFFCYLSLFATAMLGLVLSNSLLLTFM